MSVQINNKGDILEIAPRATQDKLSFWGATAAVQPTNASQAAIGAFETIGNVADAANGSAISASITNNFNTVKTLTNRLRTDLVALGLIKGS